jgi:hypothetical protein
MTSQLANIVGELETKLKAIDTALDALRDVDGETAGPSALVSIPATASTTEPGRKKFSAATRRKMKAAQLARYARARAGAEKVPF